MGFGGFLGKVLAAPLRVIEVVAAAVEPIDFLDVQDMAGDAADRVEDTVKDAVER